LIDRGELTEGVLHVGDVKGAEKVFMVNSVRDWVPLEIVN
jgi:branched-subunit amino acid aminotransferase/4-amino-4-deoxychorismate lyase